MKFLKVVKKLYLGTNNMLFLVMYCFQTKTKINAARSSITKDGMMRRKPKNISSLDVLWHLMYSHHYDRDRPLY